MARDAIQGLHHITLCTGTAQGDVDFFVKVIGQRMVKKTLFYDGAEPIYHLYFADELGTPGTVMTTFPMRRTGIVGRRGSGQISAIAYSVPVGSLDFWLDHLSKHEIPASGPLTRFGERYISFAHPSCGIPFEVIESPDDSRKAWKSEYVPADKAVRGFHNWTATVRDLEDMDAFLEHAWNFKRVASEGKYTRYAVNGGGAARLIDIRVEPDLRQGTWTVGEGTVHHCAFEVPSLEIQAKVKADAEGMGFTDFSDRKNRGYFESMYVRTPGGVMFEATFSLGFDVDESPADYGKGFHVSPQFEDQIDEILKKMNDPISV